MPKGRFPTFTASARVKGYTIYGTLIEGNEEEKNGVALYYFPNDAVLGDAWEVVLAPEEARSAKTIGALARKNYRALRQ